MLVMFGRRRPTWRRVAWVGWVVGAGGACRMEQARAVGSGFWTWALLRMFRR
jgi:hypothetical protein